MHNPASGDKSKIFKNGKESLVPKINIFLYGSHSLCNSLPHVIRIILPWCEVLILKDFLPQIVFLIVFF